MKDCLKDSFSNNWRDTISNLPKSMPDCVWKFIPVRKSLKTSCFPWCYHPRIFIVYRAHCLIAPFFWACSGSKGWTIAIWIQAYRLRNFILLSRGQPSVSCSDVFGMFGWIISIYNMFFLIRFDISFVPNAVRYFINDPSVEEFRLNMFRIFVKIVLG